MTQLPPVKYRYVHEPRNVRSLRFLQEIEITAIIDIVVCEAVALTCNPHCGIHHVCTSSDITNCRGISYLANEDIIHLGKFSRLLRAPHENAHPVTSPLQFTDEEPSEVAGRASYQRALHGMSRCCGLMASLSAIRAIVAVNTGTFQWVVRYSELYNGSSPMQPII